MTKFRKKPIVIEAITFDELVKHGLENSENIHNGMPWSWDYKGQPITHENDECYLVPTMEGIMKMTPNDMLITGVKGEIYPCKIDIFEATYEKAGENKDDKDFDGLLSEWKGTFGQAIESLKHGQLVARKGWNGKAMFLFIRPEDELTTGFIPKVKSLPQAVKDYIDKHVDDKINPGEQGLTPVKFTSYICMKAADGSIVNGWLASQTDMLSEDWGIVRY